MQDSWTAHALCVLPKKDTVSSMQGTDVAEELARWHLMHTLRQGQEQTLSLKQRKNAPHTATSPAQAFSLDKAVVQAQDPFL